MFAYLSPGEYLTAVLSSAATTAPTYFVQYSEGEAVTESQGTLSDTAATVVSAPATGQRKVKSFVVYNGDSAAATVTLKKVAATGTSYTRAPITLAAGDLLQVDANGIATVNSAGNEPTSSAIGLLDAVDLSFGDSADAIARWSTGDASDHSFVIGLGDTSQMLHITDKAAVASDWAISSPSHPTLYVHSNTTPTTDYLRIGGHDGTSADIDLVGGTTLNTKVDGTAVTVVTAAGFQNRGAAAVTATTGGGTTGLIPAGASHVTVTSDSADKQISLPAAAVGDEIWILVGATACELISAVAAHKVNDVTVGATNEAALTATNLYWCKYVATNTWVVVGYTKLGAVQAALVPDSL